MLRPPLQVLAYLEAFADYYELHSLVSREERRRGVPFDIKTERHVALQIQLNTSVSKLTPLPSSSPERGGMQSPRWRVETCRMECHEGKAVPVAGASPSEVSPGASLGHG